VQTRYPNLAVMPGSEHYLADAIAAGAAGCISGSVALWPELAQTVCRKGSAGESQQLADRRMALDGFPFIPAVRHCIARLRNDDAWHRPMPPLVGLGAAQRAELDARLDALAVSSLSGAP
jgi:4-hydroxy-tetrahydrodipicolinate synthase